MIDPVWKGAVVAAGQSLFSSRLSQAAANPYHSEDAQAVTADKGITQARMLSLTTLW